jgi:hypothetical protein
MATNLLFNDADPGADHFLCLGSEIIFLDSDLIFKNYRKSAAELWIRTRHRIGSGFNDFVDPDSESGSGSMGKKNEEKKCTFP